MKIEPPADFRYAAVSMHSVLVAYIDAGFTREESFQLVRDLLIANLTGGKE